MKLSTFLLCIGFLAFASPLFVAHAEKNVGTSTTLEESTVLESDSETTIETQSGSDIAPIGVHDVIRRDMPEIERNKHGVRDFFSSHKEGREGSLLTPFTKHTTSLQTEDRTVVRERVSKNFEVGLHNLENIMTRLSSRINKIENAGEDTAEIDALMSEANSSFATAKEKVSEIQVLFKDSSATKESVQALALEARNALTDTRATLMNVVQSIKDAVGVQSQSTTSATLNESIH